MSQSEGRRYDLHVAVALFTDGETGDATELVHAIRENEEVRRILWRRVRPDDQTDVDTEVPSRRQTWHRAMSASAAKVPSRVPARWPGHTSVDLAVIHRALARATP